MRVCTLFSGSSGNCVYIEDGGTALLVDAGKNLRAVCGGLAKIGKSMDEISALLVTHDHIDHVAAIELLSRRYDLPILARRGVLEGIVRRFPSIPSGRLTALNGNGFTVGGVRFVVFGTPHDADDSSGFVFTGSDGKKVAVVTDLGGMTDGIMEAAAGVDLAVLEANYDPDMLRYGPYPAFLKRRIASPVGHLSNSDCADAACLLAERNCGRFVLAHISETNNTPELALEAVRGGLALGGFCLEGIEIDCAPRHSPGRIREV